MKLLYYILLSLLTFSCNDADKGYKEKIIGTWKFEENLYRVDYYRYTEIPPPPFFNKLGYSFFKDNTYKIHTNMYSTEKLKYVIENDSIRLQSPSDKKWQSFKLTVISSDTLSFTSNDKIPKKFSRVRYHDSGTSKIDRIIISSSGCYGECPIENLSINSNGSIMFMGQDYTVKEGFYTSNVSPDRFKRLLAYFEKAGFESLNDDYYANHTDDETISITFVRNDSIIKTIEDYGNEAPSEFIWAYTHLRHLSKQLDLKKENEFAEDFPISQMFFRKDNHQGEISKSEMFMLYTEIQKAKITDVVFKSKYALKLFFGEHMEAIYTDGRYYSLPHRGEVFDLGYNFFERNNLDARLEPVEE